MRRVAWPFALLIAIAHAARADDRASTAFLGSETTWREARLSLHPGHGFGARREVHVQGSGQVIVRARDRDGERRYEVTIPAQEARAVLRVAVEADLLTVEPPRRPGAPDEDTPTLRLRNARGGVVFVTKWASDDLPRWDRVADALERLATTIERRHEPVHCGPNDLDLIAAPWTRDLPAFAMTVDRGTFRGRGVELTDADLDELRSRLRDLPRVDRVEGPDRELWVRVHGVRGLPEEVRVGGGAVWIYAAPHEDARGLEAWLLERMRRAGVDLDG